MAENIIIEKLTEHDGRFEAVGRRLEAIAKKLDKSDEQHDDIFKKLVERDYRLDQLAFKISSCFNEILSSQAKILAKLERIEMESAALVSWIKRTEKEM